MGSEPIAVVVFIVRIKTGSSIFKRTGFAGAEEMNDMTELGVSLRKRIMQALERILIKPEQAGLV
jgi:hypothetical protein